ncbi:MAG: SCO1664 family protein [Sporichthyaceae bacterium]
MTQPDSAPDPVAAVPVVPVSELGLDNALTILSLGTVEVVGQLTNASNATLFCAVTLDGVTVAAAHKPVAGEKPLWDFPDGTLAGREVSAYRVSAATGWDLIPPTVLREGPWGPGMCQLWVEVDENAQLFTMERDRDGYISLDALVPASDERLRRMAVLDVVLNNADRKGGHLLPTPDGRVQGIDHGLCFSTDEKLRTLLWAWAGRSLTGEALEVLARLDADFETVLAPAVADLLTPREIAKTRVRIARLLRTGRHPKPREDGYPAVPWPPF